MVKATASVSKKHPEAAQVFRLVGGRLRRQSPPAETSERVGAPAQAGRAGGMTPEQIRDRAYEKWCRAGRPTGDGVHFWLEAERELMAES
ncbi:DUF2934 domain-containing protein [Limnoglobus roseus]|uniref:DUF2934 domain-containing protein n=1 Tax=Limnoglobus roseus TaxID=2598579 RepID=A0A5C1AHG2_9BACT|nr:DUF2934 domain-containing protein [Limnoglobus roseus]QEL17607.1 hypothetical protein PX52LOC_04603 [Limnoglobus roseus]